MNLFPGHGLKGKQRVIENDEDIIAMYADYKGKRIITLWMKCSWKQRSSQRKKISFPKCKWPTTHIKAVKLFLAFNYDDRGGNDHEQIEGKT